MQRLEALSHREAVNRAILKAYGTGKKARRLEAICAEFEQDGTVDKSEIAAFDRVLKLTEATKKWPVDES